MSNKKSFNDFGEEKKDYLQIDLDQESRNNNSRFSIKNINRKENKNNKYPSPINKDKDKTDKIFNCPMCLEKISQDSFNIDSISITQKAYCKKCDKKILYINCLHCNRKIYSYDQEFKLGINILCPYIDCDKNFTFTICGGCKKYIAIKEKYLEGNAIKCPYDDCQMTSSTVLCPFEECEFPNSFQENKYFEGYQTKCISSKCKRIFSKFNCNFCFRRFYLDDKSCENLNEGMKIQCPYEDCKKAFNKFYCACCQRINIIENSVYKGLCKKNFNYFKCAYEDCLKTFLKINCPKCLFVIQYIGKNNLEGKNLSCDNLKCNFSFTFSYCTDCEGLNIWEGN